MKPILLIILSLICFGTSRAQVFVQNFNQSANVTDYVNPGTPDKGQFNYLEAEAPGKVAIVNNKLRLIKAGPGGRPFFARTSPLDSKSQFISFAFKIDAKAQGDATAFLAIGNGFSAGALPDSVNKCYVRLLFHLTSNGFSIRNSNQSQEGLNKYTGESQITWYINRSGKMQTYTAPDGSAQSISHDRWDLWVGNNKEFSAAGCTNTHQSMSNFKFSFLSSQGEIGIDDLIIKDL